LEKEWIEFEISSSIIISVWTSLEGKKTEPNRTEIKRFESVFGSVRFKNLKKINSVWLFILVQNRTKPDQKCLALVYMKCNSHNKPCQAEDRDFTWNLDRRWAKVTWGISLVRTLASWFVEEINQTWSSFLATLSRTKWWWTSIYLVWV
jgi:hypothetical protein